MATGYYRSGFIAADERAKSMQNYFNKFHDLDLSDTELERLVKRGNGFLYPILRGTEYYTRLKTLNEYIKDRKAKNKPLTRSQIANKILQMQQEYADLAGIFGRPSIKGVERMGGIEEKIKEAMLKEIGGEEELEDEQTDNMEL